MLVKLTIAVYTGEKIKIIRFFLSLKDNFEIFFKRFSSFKNVSIEQITCKILTIKIDICFYKGPLT